MRRDQGEEFRGLVMRDPQGRKIGRVREVWADEHTGEPAWLCVDTGFLGRHHSYVPAGATAAADDHVAVSIPKRVVAGAPRVRPVGNTMEAVEQDVLIAYYRTEVRR